MSNADFVPDGNTTLEDKQKEVLQKFLDEQQAFDRQFREHHAELLDQTKSMRDQLVKKLKSKDAQITPEIQGVVKLLVQYPMLAPVVTQFIENKITAIKQAVNSVLKP
jgi:2-hydroxy-3-keto-5-methylthiopentenyl-1-phosphate phosphatase